MTYNLPDGDVSSYVSGFTNVLYGQTTIHE